VFEKESGTAPGVDLGAITDRMEIRKAVQAGHVEEAIERVNDLNPEVGTWSKEADRLAARQTDQRAGRRTETNEIDRIYSICSSCHTWHGLSGVCGAIQLGKQQGGKH
jgi:hypothetical protein